MILESNAPNGARDFDSPAGSARQHGPFYGGEGRLAGHLVLADAEVPFREGDQQARLINGAFDGWLHSAPQKSPAESGAKFATHLRFAGEAANPPLNVERRSCFVYTPDRS